MKCLPRFLIAGLLAAALCLPVQADEFLENLHPNQVVQGFRTVNLYDNASGQAMGARFISEKNGFIIDLLQIESVPQAFYWIKTPITASRGEPHACEHLLLGKGNRGRYVAALEDMTLSNSTAYTEQYRTCYHFNTISGDETFHRIFEAKLQALLHPDFSDEEIRREVCHIGVATNPDDSTLALEEKGTVYTEMVSSFERPYYHTYRRLYQLVYGEDHPLTHCAGGDPDVMRGMVPQDLRDFHQATHHLANMGAIVSLPKDVPIAAFLQQMSATLDRCENAPDSSALPGIGNFSFPSPDAAAPGTSELVKYPSDRAEDPGYLLYSWPADLSLAYREKAMLSIFLEAFSGGENSDLYKLFIDSKTRQIDIGATAVNGWIDDNFGLPISFSLTGVNSSHVDRQMLDSVAVMIVQTVRRIHDYPDDGDQLRDFNTRVRNRLIEHRKRAENNLNQPPMFGFRTGPAGAWLTIMEDLERVPGFRKSLILADQIDYIDSLLSLPGNIWRERIDSWRLLTNPPYKVGATPSPDIVSVNAASKQARLAGYVTDFENKYGVTDPQLAIAKYKADFDANTAVIESAESKSELPGFVDNPPMTLDDQLDFKTITLPGKVPLVASTFDNMTSARVGLALRLDVIPESLMVYVPFLPRVLSQIGAVKDGKVVTFDEMQERLRREVLNMNAYFSPSFASGRVDLVLAGQGGNQQELFNALDWMDAALYSPYLASENLPRILDCLDQMIQSGRNRMRGSEESWVTSPATGYRFDNNPLMMSSVCFLTQIHSMQRLRWLLTDPGDQAAQSELSAFIDALQTTGAGKSREEIANLLGSLESATSGSQGAAVDSLTVLFAGLSDNSRSVIKILASSLRQTLGDIPDASLADDWRYLCRQARSDLLTPPDRVLSRMQEILAMILRTDNARMFMVSNSADREACMARIETLIGKLNKQSSPQQKYSADRRVLNRLAGRDSGATKPLYAGLVHQGTQNGVLIFNARLANQYDTASSAVLNCLAGQLYGGGGPHGLFMKTWAAGLAYSNGYGYNQQTGRVSYYAERCPDVAQTMRFVVDELKNAQPDSGLVDYAIAQVFGSSRAPNRYEQRGEAMAADLADGLTPEVVKRFNQKVLQTRRRQNLFNDLKGRMETAYGPVLIGYGQPLAKSNDGYFFLIGPEKQFQSLEQYIASTESPQTVYRLYPRDFWLAQ